MKQKLLIIGITMAAAGSEKSFLSFAETIDYDQYDVDLLLAVREGDFLALVPNPIRVTDMGEMGEIFKINRENAKEIILRRYVRGNPMRLAALLPYYIKIKTAKTERERAFAANRLWLKLMSKMPMLDGEYDAALAYWGDHTMFYMIDKVRAKKKIAWLHFDYAEPPREDALYEAYFKKCDRVVTVSESIEKSLKAALPAIADRVVTLENRVDRDRILRDAAEEADFGDDGDVLRIVTVGRICPQKGQDIALGAILRLIREGYPIRWYLLGKADGERDYCAALEKRIDDAGARDAVRFLGTRQNPYPLMRAADIYLQPSRHEGKPIAVEEAKILCRPIVATRYASAGEQLGDCGVLCEITENGICEALKGLLDAPERRTELTERLRKWEAPTPPAPLAMLLSEKR